jgi:hypothetical protein
MPSSPQLPRRPSAKSVGLILVFGLLHYAIFTVTYVQSAVMHPRVANSGSLPITVKVLSFPFGYVAAAGLPIDIFPIMIAANSLLWGVICTAAVIGCLRLAKLARH